MANRITFTSASTPPVTGKQLLDNLAEKIDILFDAIALIPTSITNSGNDYTIIVDPVLTADVVNNMFFWITPSVSNTGATRLRVAASNPYYDWVKVTGAPYASGELVAGTTYGVLFVGGQFRTVTVQSATSAQVSINYQVFTASGTWTKPTGVSADAFVHIELWGGGAGGSSGSATAGGGGGGAYNYGQFKASALSLTETVTIGAGGAADSSGGNSTFGSRLSAFGGGVGSASSSNLVRSGGGGGGQLSAGGIAVADTGGTGGAPGGGAGGITSGNGANGNSGGGGANGIGGDGIFGGGGGGGAQGPSSAQAGGKSLYGGGGGGGDSDGADSAGGTSVFGGAGGAGQSVAVAGTAPGGGGGASSGTSAAAGARGECRVWTIG